MAPRLELSWRLAVDHGDAEALSAALSPDSEGHLDLAVVGEGLVATGSGTPGTVLHTLDDLLACLSAAHASLDAAEP